MLLLLLTTMEKLSSTLQRVNAITDWPEHRLRNGIQFWLMKMICSLVAQLKIIAGSTTSGMIRGTIKKVLLFWKKIKQGWASTKSCMFLTLRGLMF